MVLWYQQVLNILDECYRVMWVVWEAGVSHQPAVPHIAPTASTTLAFISPPLLSDPACSSSSHPVAHVPPHTTHPSSVSLEEFQGGWWWGAHRGGLVTCRPRDSTGQSKCVMQGSRVEPKLVM